jgi:AraC-like DNA-binding protein/mannose-6-phosphate isomerase-like protein (cupin superfamily)
MREPLPAYLPASNAGSTEELASAAATGSEPFAGSPSRPSSGDAGTSGRRERTRVRPVAHAPSAWLLDATYTTHTFSLHSHDEIEIGVNESGTARFSIGGRVRRLEPGHLLLAGPHEAHSGQRVGHRPWEYRAVLLHPGFLRPLDQAAGLPAPAVRFRSPLAHDPALATAVLDLHRLVATGGTAREEIGRLTRLLTEVIGRHALPEKGATSTEGHPAAEQVRSHLEAHFREHVSLDSLSELTELSRYHLLRVFKRATGLPPNAYQQCLRIRAAQRMLRSGSPIARVALEVGFASVSHFTRQFKKIVGAPPGVWTRGVRQPFPSY